MHMWRGSVHTQPHMLPHTVTHGMLYMNVYRWWEEGRESKQTV